MIALKQPLDPLDVAAAEDYLRELRGHLEVANLALVYLARAGVEIEIGVDETVEVRLGSPPLLRTKTLSIRSARMVYQLGGSR